MPRKKYANEPYRVEITETGDELGFFKTYRDALNYLKKNEREDRIDGTFTPGFYTISRFNNQHWYEPIYDSKHGEYGYRPTRKVTKKSTKKTVKKKIVKRK